MKHVVRILIMTAMTGVVVMSILGFEHTTWEIVGTMVVLGGLPVLAGTAALHGVEQQFGGSSKYFIAGLGLLPAAFFVFVSASMQVKGLGNDYSTEVMSAGFVWSIAWVFTSSIAQE
ncbi:hypothetical protein IB237_15400 [Agrobacterium sp. AGB01]|uniref:hypothetical protein n=1 Tax=Agrobacterium sp. AGB01 TaxID=2769302 RepID=UPI001785F7D9|nr:hypothetical protein [Agrobacterium sp. AGB01]MBD9388568.1 hypothetical protein [Agrobacterium sp. AGB01]